MKNLLLVLLFPFLFYGCKDIKEDYQAEEIWLAIGQSNMELARNFTNEDVGNVMVRNGKNFYYDEPTDYWEPLQEVDYFSEVAGYFGLHLSKLKNKQIKIISNALGGTKLACWEAGGECDKSGVKPFKDENITGVIWWQGESDAISNSEDISLYEDRLENFIKSLDIVFDAKLSFVIVGLESYCPGTYDAECAEMYNWVTIRNAQLSIAARNENVGIFDASTVTSGLEMHPYSVYETVGIGLANVAYEL